MGIQKVTLDPSSWSPGAHTFLPKAHVFFRGRRLSRAGVNGGTACLNYCPVSLAIDTPPLIVPTSSPALATIHWLICLTSISFSMFGPAL